MAFNKVLKNVLPDCLSKEPRTLGFSVFTGSESGDSGGQFTVNSESSKGEDPHYSSSWCALLNLLLQVN